MYKIFTNRTFTHPSHGGAERSPRCAAFIDKSEDPGGPLRLSALEDKTKAFDSNNKNNNSASDSYQEGVN